MNFAYALSLILCDVCYVTSFKQRIPAVNSYDPGSCNNTIHGQEVLVKDKADEEIILICVKDKGVYHWRATYGTKSTVGEYFNPGEDCTDILNKLQDAKDGTYWIASNSLTPRKVWCDQNTDGGGFMLVGRKNSSITWTVPSNDVTVEPYGEPHWSSSLGDIPILDFRIQMATREDFKSTKAHWSYRLQSKRPLKNLMMNTAGCDQRTAGIGNIAYVKDLLTEKIVTTKLRCSKFGYDYHHLIKFGWHQMNSCLQKPCPRGFAFHGVAQVDVSGGFSFSTTRNISGMEYKATAFVGCDNGHCCGCYGPVGGRKDYCDENCKAINGGTVTKNVFTWFWVRSSLPKRVWKKCMDYEEKREDGKLISYKLVGDSILPVEGRCAKDSALLHDGIVVVPDSSTAQKVPAIDGLLEYRKDKQELYVRANKTWNALAQKEKILQETSRKDKLNLDKITKLEQNLNNEKQIMDGKDKLHSDKIKKLEQNLKDEKKIILQETDKKDKLNLDKIIKLGQNLNNVKQMVNQKINQLEKLIKKHDQLLPQHSECFKYKWLKESTRNQKYTGSPRVCDRNTLSTGWYRFGGGAGTKLPTSCVPAHRCGTHASGWMNGAHSTVAEGKVTRKVCYNHGNHCCQWSNYIEVVNCGQYYVYKLSPPPVCTLRYCGS